MIYVKAMDVVIAGAKGGATSTTFLSRILQVSYLENHALSKVLYFLQI